MLLHLNYCFNGRATIYLTGYLKLWRERETFKDSMVQCVATCNNLISFPVHAKLFKDKSSDVLLVFEQPVRFV